VRALAQHFGDHEAESRESGNRVRDRARKQRAAMELQRQAVKE
jgi:hypothetical protein